MDLLIPSDPSKHPQHLLYILQWLDALITLAVPKTMQFEDAQKMCKDRWGDDVILFTNDKDGNGERLQMLQTFPDLIEDADIPVAGTVKAMINHTVNRIKRVLSTDDTRRFCLWKQLKNVNMKNMVKQLKSCDFHRQSAFR